MKENFDVHNWNKRRYLGELDISDEEEGQNVSAANLSGDVNITRGGDDPKTGAEQESDDNVVGEGVNDREIKGKLSDLTYDFLSNYFETERFNAPNPDDSSRTIYSPGQWEDWKQGIMKRFGDVDVKLDNQGNFDSDKERIIKNREKIDKQVEDLKKVIDESEIEDGVEKIKEMTEDKSYKKMSKKDQDKLFMKNMKEVAPDFDLSRFDLKNSEVSSLPFDTNINMDTSSMYDEDLIDENPTQIFIVNRPYVVKE